MDIIDRKFDLIRKYFLENRNPDRAAKYARYFTEGYDAYGIDRELFHAQRDHWVEKWSDELSLDDYLRLGEKLISTGKYEEASLAILFLDAHKSRLTPQLFQPIGNWLEKGIINWGHTDVLAGLILDYFITEKIIDIESFQDWTASESKWKRRAVPVSMISALKVDIPLDRIFCLIEPLMTDREKFVQKGLGWFLREAWKKYPDKTESFLLKWKDTCGRTIIQYATEKMDKQNKSRFKRNKILIGGT